MRFGDVVAVNSVSVELPRGGIHALIGQNGAGKTTLARTIAGLQEFESGSVEVNGVSIPSAGYLDAREAGVDMVHQHPSLIPDLTVAESLELTDPSATHRPYSRQRVERRWKEYLESHGVRVDVRRLVRDLSVELVQSVEIARSNPGVGGLLILDEPTAALPPSRIEALFERLRATAAQGVTVLVVLHKLAEVRDLADTVTALRAGSVVLDTTPLGHTSDAELSRRVVGAALATPKPSASRHAADASPAAIEMRSLCCKGRAGDSPLRDVDLTVKPGEIVGVAGVEGNGQRSLVDVLVGLEAPSSGLLRVLDANIAPLSISDRRDLGIRVIPFDRSAEGMAGELPLWQNVLSWDAGSFRSRKGLPLVSVARMRKAAKERLAAFSVVYGDIDQPASSLSGGNAQRMILARELPGSKVLIAAQPTRGLDIGGVHAVWGAFREQASKGVPILIASSDLDELLEHTDRLAVMRGGSVVAVHEHPYDVQAIGEDMIGARTDA
ncbi:MAG: ATP-binding cassette domain-containing protein [bacterium]|nr:ATP-binding cassette domain-containing protein [bacterium]MCY4271629.1 ATP-binding cassette domain-containing protein [bacterium]